MKGKVFSQGSQFFLQENFFHPKAAGALSCCHHVRGFIFKTSEDLKFFFNKKVLTDVPIPICSQ